jgi:hypothetical protein
MRYVIQSQGNLYDVLLDSGGDHIVCKHDKKDPDHAYVVDKDGTTFARVIRLAQEMADADAENLGSVR